MSTARIKEGLKGIANEVLVDVQKEAEEIILKAEKNAKEILKAAKNDSDKIYATAMAEVVARAAFEKRKIDSKADVDVRNQLLKVKEALMQSAFEKAQLRLNEIINEDAYKALLSRLIEEAAKKIGSKKLIVKVNSKDKVWLKQFNMDFLSKRLRADLILAEETTTSIGGCIVQTVDGKIVYDNTFENRIQQLEPAVRPEIAMILFQKEGSSNDR